MENLLLRKKERSKKQIAQYRFFKHPREVTGKNKRKPEYYETIIETGFFFYFLIRHK